MVTDETQLRFQIGWKIELANLKQRNCDCPSDSSYLSSPQYEQVLHHLLPQVVVNPINFLLFEQPRKVLAELSRTLRILTERLFNYYTRPSPKIQK